MQKSIKKNIIFNIIKYSIFGFLLDCKQCTTQETPECVDSGTYFELFSSQNMQTRPKLGQNTWN